jgi:hypothetical protein
MQHRGAFETAHTGFLHRGLSSANYSKPENLFSREVSNNSQPRHIFSAESPPYPSDRKLDVCRDRLHAEQ